MVHLVFLRVDVSNARADKLIDCSVDLSSGGSVASSRSLSLLECASTVHTCAHLCTGVHKCVSTSVHKCDKCAKACTSVRNTFSMDFRWIFDRFSIDFR